MYTPVEIKAELLSKGIALSKNLIDNFDKKFLEKRRAYGNADPFELRYIRIPQEVYIDPYNTNLIVSVNVNNESEWVLEYLEGEYFLSNYNYMLNYRVCYPERPNYYDCKLKNNQNVSQVVTLYGGGSIGIFAYGKCHLVDIGKPCHYCSISQNRDKGTDFFKTISAELISEALSIVLHDKSNTASQVMLNGGNFRDRDKSFIHYVKLVKAILKLIKENESKMDVHLIVYPPENLDLISELNGLDISLAMNTEVFNSELFKIYCPGKSLEDGQQHIFSALSRAVQVLGKGKVYSLLVGGLEPLNSLKLGLDYLSALGVVPVINVLHTDPGTPLEKFTKPTPEEIIAMGKELQNIYTKHNFKPFYDNCGRNSIDSEAYKKLFHQFKL